MAETKVTQNELASDTVGAWISWTPTLTNLSGGTLNFAKYTKIGKTVKFKLKYTLGGAGVSGDIRFTLPVTANSDEHPASGGNPVGLVSFLDNGTAIVPGIVNLYSSAGTAQLLGYVANGTYASFTGLNSTIPFTWASNDAIYARGEYEAA